LISLVGTISRKSLKLLPPAVIFLKLKCTKFYFGWSSAPDPAGGGYSALPDPLAGVKGKEGRGRKGPGRRGWEGKGVRGGEVEGERVEIVWPDL